MNSRLPCRHWGSQFTADHEKTCGSIILYRDSLGRVKVLGKGFGVILDLTGRLKLKDSEGCLEIKLPTILKVAGSDVRPEMSGPDVRHEVVLGRNCAKCAAPVLSQRQMGGCEGSAATDLANICNALWRESDSDAADRFWSLPSQAS